MIDGVVPTDARRPGGRPLDGRRAGRRRGRYRRPRPRRAVPRSRHDRRPSISPSRSPRSRSRSTASVASDRRASTSRSSPGSIAWADPGAPGPRAAHVVANALAHSPGWPPSVDGDRGTGRPAGADPRRRPGTGIAAEDVDHVFERFYGPNGPRDRPADRCGERDRDRPDHRTSAADGQRRTDRVEGRAPTGRRSSSNCPWQSSPC